ncbi:two-component system response regulator [Spirochaetia bacterium]|nr:two-component system response regulator [Spirochaetia bacterium]
MPLNEMTPTVLVVDDIDMNVMILEEILQDDYHIITANNGKNALEALHKAQVLPKIILLDVMMPEMNGREMFDILKTDATFNRIPVIFITAENDSEGELLAAGAVDFINKPFTPEIVKLRVRNQIELKKYSDSLEEMVAEQTAAATKTLDSALQGLANVIEHRDMESGEHVKRTQFYVRALINYLIDTNSVYARELKDLQPEIIVKSMALHDVGKIAIPDRILQKPGRLDPDEYEIMKTHTIEGKVIIGELGDVKNSLYLKHCEDICYGHHERWDGRGYPGWIDPVTKTILKADPDGRPLGHKGEEIPIVARLAALADVYDALVCARVYKAAMANTEAVKIITEGRGTQFDPVMTDAFINIQEEFRKISEQYS